MMVNSSGNQATNMIYQIFHPRDGALNTECKPNVYEYEYITSVDALLIAGAVIMSQNENNGEYAKLNKRSTTQGDIIRFDDKNYILNGNTFQQVDDKWISYIDWTKHHDSVYVDMEADQLHTQLNILQTVRKTSADYESVQSEITEIKEVLAHRALL